MKRMKRKMCISIELALLNFLIVHSSLFPQDIRVTGELRGSMSNNTLHMVRITSVNTGRIAHTDKQGQFTMRLSLHENDTLIFDLSTFQSLRIPMEKPVQDVDLGRIYLEMKRENNPANNVLRLNDVLLDESVEGDINIGLLSSGRDLLFRRAAFDFGQVFYRVRGYDSRNSSVLINGMQMNRMQRGRPQWNNWGGLNEVFRSQEFTPGLQASPWHFGGVLGITNIESRPGANRSGYRFTTSLSNRTYLARLMATVNRPPENKNLGYTASVSGRWGEQGYVNGVGYEAFSAYGAVEYELGEHSSVYATALIASNKRGRNAPITEEVHELKGRKYNPYWGMQSSKIRNSRIRYIEEPLLMLNYRYQDKDMFIAIGIGYQWGIQASSRIGYFNAPNPQPDYYRYLPSYFLNNSFGANIISAREAQTSFVNKPQINWAKMYQANRSSQDGKAYYILYNDAVKSNIYRGHFHLNWKIWEFSFIDFGSNISFATSDFHSRIMDLLGAEYHLDIDPFSDTSNNLDANADRKEEDIFGYNYQIDSKNLEAFLQFRFTKSKWNGFLSSRYYRTSYLREGFYRNERFPDNSLGKGQIMKFSNYGFKGGVSYQLSRRHRLETHGAYFFRAPAVAGTYINPRENHETVPDIEDEKISSVDINYVIQLPAVRARLTAYYTRFQHATDINFFYVDSGVGSDFVQQVLTGLDRLHKGLEIGITYDPTSSVSITAVASIAEFLFASDPRTTINFDTAGPEEDLIDINGTLDLGYAKIKDLHLGRGPSHAFSLGIDYRDPNYWWVGTTFNLLSENYIQLSPITRTESFNLDPETGRDFEHATDENIALLLAQQPLEPVYLVNLNAGKSWKFGDIYLGLFLSISNLLDTEFKSGGYEQSRNGNFRQLYQDNLSNNPSFGPKYWFGYGRNFFLNVSVSL